MMDLKEIIKWFIPCFHILLSCRHRRMGTRSILICLFLFLNLCAVLGTKVNSDSEVGLNKNSQGYVDLNIANYVKYSQIKNSTSVSQNEEIRNLQNSSTGRTFGRPFKKMIQALIPIVFQLGMAATWSVVAALVGIKTLAITLIILKLLLMAGAAKIGALFGTKHQSHGWEQPHQKEIHLHIHNGQHAAHEEQISHWNREGVPAKPETSNVDVVYEPYSGGPQTISTPYGHYIKVDHLKSLLQQT